MKLLSTELSGQWALWNQSSRESSCGFASHFHLTTITPFQLSVGPHLIWPRSWDKRILKGWGTEYNLLTLLTLRLKFTVTTIIEANIRDKHTISTNIKCSKKPVMVFTIWRTLIIYLIMHGLKLQSHSNGLPLGR